MKRTEIPGLTGLRGLAAALVLASHLAFPIGFESAHPILFRTAQLGWVGVPLFFVLSGYLLTFLALKEKTKSGKFHLSQFYLRRCLRIWPLYLFLALTGIVAWEFSSLHSVALAPTWRLPLLTFTINLFLWFKHGDLVHYNPVDLGAFVPFWTVAVEEQFYLVWGVGLWLLNRRGMIMACLAVLTVSGYYRIFPGLFGFFLHYRMQVAITFGAISLGCLMALGQSGLSKRKGALKLWPVALVFAALIGALEWPFPDQAASCGLLLTSVEILCAYFLFFVLCSDPSTSRLLRFLDSGPMKMLGKMSYSIYCTQAFAIILLMRMLAKLSPGLGATPSHPVLFIVMEYAAVLGLTVVFSAFWLRVEAPIQKIRYSLA